MRPFQHVTIVFFASAGMLVAAWWMGLLSLWWLLVPVIIYLHTLVLGAIFIRWDFYLRSYHQGTNTKHIALTFDDGPAQETAAILDILKAQNVPATFFMIGKNATAHPELVQRWHEEGHLIGNHSYEHGFNFDWKSAAAMVAELEQTNGAIRSITGQTPRLFRPPYGVTNPNVAKSVKQMGMKSIGWNIRSFDTTAKDPDALLQRILSRLRGGDIILLHDSMPITRQVLTSLIEEARGRGFSFVRVDELLQISPYA